MSVYLRSVRATALVTLVLSSYVLTACTFTPSPVAEPSEPPDNTDGTEYLSVISVGVEDNLVEVHVDEEVTIWLNTIEESGNGEPPTPRTDAWYPFAMPSGESPVVFEPGAATPFDVLEILAYPEGLDSAGEPVSVEVHPLCGPQATHSCKDVSWGSHGVQIPSEVVRSAIANTEYYAIGGILLPDGDSHPDSFIVLLKKEP